MKAREIMTRDVVSVLPDTPVREIAELLVDKSISGAPVVDDEGAPVGMVSEADLIGRDEPSREARDIMTRPVVTIGEDTDAGEIARLLQTYRIKRVPVIRDGRVVGIVSRADLLRAMAQEPTPIPAHNVGLLARAIAGIDERFGLRRSPEPPQTTAAPSEPRKPGFQAADFRELVQDFEHRQDRTREEAHRAVAEERQQRVGQLINEHISDQNWQEIMHRARNAAENGEKEFMLLRFPCHLCSDRGRAIDVTEPDWPATLRGEAAEIYLRWERDLKPRGFHITAQVVDYPGGVPGDIGLFLIWG